jgi:hypothetical protein
MVLDFILIHFVSIFREHMAKQPEFMNRMNFVRIVESITKNHSIISMTIMALRIHERRALELICLRGHLRQLYCQ